MTGEVEKIDHREFAGDLAEYVKREDDESWMELVENYPFEARGDGRYVFLPAGSEQVDKSQPKNYLVAMPNLDREGERPQQDQLYQDIAEYLSTEGAVEKLIKLAEMQDEYSNSQIDEGKIRFGPIEDSGLEVSVPSLSELADAYNGEDTDYGEVDRDMLGRLASETSLTLGSYDKTVHKQGSDIYVERDTEEGTKFFKVDNVGEAISLGEAVGIYRMVRDGLTSDSGADIFESITKLFEVYEDDENKVLLDSENDQVVIYDFSTIDLIELDSEEANEHLRRHVGEDVVNKLEDFYDGIK